MAISYPKPKTFAELLTKQYEVPIYQRPYSWENIQVEELWYDLRKNDPPYFVGTLLLRPLVADKYYEVVDGQQRLATLLLLLRAATLVIGEDEPVEAQKLQDRYINQQVPLSKEPILALSLSKRDKDKFASMLLGTQFQQRKKYSSWARLDRTFDFFINQLHELKKDKGLEGIKSLITSRLLALTMLDVQVENDSDVYLFFETLNDRGMDLSIADLIKNRVCAVTSQDGGSPDDAAHNIDEITEIVGAGRMKNFLLHYCWSKADNQEPPPRKQLMDWFNKTVEVERAGFLSNLEGSALQYADFLDPKKITPAGPKRESMRFLKALDATRCYPLLLQAEVSLNQKNFIRLCNAIEILTFRHSTITKQDAKILEGVYYQLTQKIRKGVGFNEVIATLRKQASEISDRLFKAAFSEYEPQSHQIARYILFKIDQHLASKSIPPDWDSLTLEHILAEGLEWDGKDQYLERLGNHTLLSDPLNKEASNKPFVEKKENYKHEKRIQLTKELLQQKDFTKDDILRRQEKLADYALEIWALENIR